MIRGLLQILTLIYPYLSGLVAIKEKTGIVEQLIRLLQYE